MNTENVYNILWIDDEHEDMNATKGRAARNGIRLHPFKSKNMGLRELQKNIDFYDGVLLDAKCRENEDDSKGTEDTQHSIDAKELINSLEKKFEIFVLTGQSEDHIDGSYKKIFKNVYEKGNNEHFEELLDRLKESAKTLKDTQLKHKYSEVFRLANEGLLDGKTNTRLLELVKYLEGEDELSERELTPLRKIIENLFAYLKSIDLLPAEIAEEKGWINKSSRFLAGRDDRYVYNEKLLPPLIAESIHRLLNITQDGSHGDGELRLAVDDYLASTKNNYLFVSTTYLLFDILSWFGSSIVQHSNRVANKAKWKKKVHGEEVTGTVKRVQGGYGTFLSDTGHVECSIIPSMMEEYNLSLGMKITITTKPDPKNPENIHIDKII